MAKRLGILTGGGDAPGLNAVIRAVVKTAHREYGAVVIGIEHGFDGLLQDDPDFYCYFITGIQTSYIHGTFNGISHQTPGEV